MVDYFSENCLRHGRIGKGVYEKILITSVQIFQFCDGTFKEKFPKYRQFARQITMKTQLGDKTGVCQFWNRFWWKPLCVSLSS